MLIKIGDIFRCSWGYDQTNVDFYQVTRVISQKPIELRAIESQYIGSESVFPCKDRFIGEVMRRRPRITNNGCYVNGEYDNHSASLWDGKPCYATSPENWR